MTDDNDILDQIAQEIGEITEEQDPEAKQGTTDDDADEGPEDMDKRNMDEYDGDW